MKTLPSINEEQINKTVCVKPSAKASLRTKNRINEHGSFMLIKNIGTPVCMQGVESVYFLAPDGWFGWLPLEELDIKVQKALK